MVGDNGLGTRTAKNHHITINWPREDPWEREWMKWPYLQGSWSKVTEENLGPKAQRGIMSPVWALHALSLTELSVVTETDMLYRTKCEGLSFPPAAHNFAFFFFILPQVQLKQGKFDVDMINNRFQDTWLSGHTTSWVVIICSTLSSNDYRICTMSHGWITAWNWTISNLV